MNSLINIQTNEQNEQRVSARELYKALEIKKSYRFSEWFKTNSKLFTENADFWCVVVTTQRNQNGGTQRLEDYSMTLEMAKHVAMMSGTPKGSDIRNYFIQVENEYKNLLSNPKYQMAMGLKASQLVIEQKDHLIEEMKPKAIFADAVTSSKTSILVGDLAKLLKQNGVDMGGRRLFEWLRNNGYLIRRNGADYNSPTQRSMEQGLFEIKESSHINGDGVNVIKKTPKVTGKGQQYFINKFLGSDQIELDMEVI